jgi:hypothetical protein
MAITAANATYEGQGPTVSGQVMVQGPGGGIGQTLYGFANVVLDGTLTAFTVNFIDGTATLPFTPSAVVVFPCGTYTAATTITALSVSAITATGFVVNFSAAGTNGNTYKIVFIAFK